MSTRVDPEPGRYGFPQPAFEALGNAPRPPLPRFRSPVRGTWLTSVFGFVLLIGLPIMLVTGFLSYAAYDPQFPGNALPGDPGLLRLPYFDWPTNPAWLYRLNQGVHVVLGLALVPIVLAKLWSVLPKLFVWPPARSFAQILERASLLLLVGGILFELITGVMNIQYDYAWGFDFYTAHYYGAWVFLAAFALHVALKLPTMRRTLKARSLREELSVDREHTVPEPPDEHGLVSPDPAEPTISRRGVLALVGSGSLAITALTIGQTAGNGLRPTALLSVRGQDYGDGPNDFQVNRTATAAQITDDLVGDSWRLTLIGPAGTQELTRADLLAMPQRTEELPIACVEGWSTTQTWTGVRLRDLAALAGLPDPDSAQVLSLERQGAFNRTVLNGGQVTSSRSLLALQVNGADLSLNHGFPARVIVPALPGVRNTKWVRQIELMA